MLKTKKGFIIRSMGDEYIILAVGEAANDYKNMIRTNETGAFYWNELEKGIEMDELIRRTMERFEDLDPETAEHDVHEFLDAIAPSLEETV